KARTLGRPVADTTARATVSLASQPECANQTRPAARFGTLVRSVSARLTEARLAEARMLAPGWSESASLTAFRTGGCECPSAAAPHEAEKSCGRPPSSLCRKEPLPPTTASGKKRRWDIRDSAARSLS